MNHDKALIDSLGGPARVAELLGLKRDGGVQRVFNWTTRGIPPRVKLQYPEIFLNQEHAPSATSVSNRHIDGGSHPRP